MLGKTPAQISLGISRQLLSWIYEKAFSLWGSNVSYFVKFKKKKWKYLYTDLAVFPSFSLKTQS